jgi:sigma-B regulation protein RsbU (phosphoserine phosphatase)
MLHLDNVPRHRPARKVVFSSRRELAKLAAAQRRMLPQSAPEIPGYELALLYRPSDAATGDYHDFFHLPNARTGVFVGDGSGHGPAASLLAATVRALFHTYPNLHGEAGNTLGTAGRLLHDLIPSDLFMTGLYLALEEDGQVTWASAGHEPPLRVSLAGQVTVTDLTAVGMPLGINPDETYTTVRWQLAPGERLLLFTDGLWEVPNRAGQAFGRRGLQRELAARAGLPLGDMVRGLVARATEHHGREDFEDDFTVVGVERRIE